MPGWFPQDLKNDPIASKVFALRLRRLRTCPGVTIGEPDFVDSAGVSQVRAVQTLLSQSQWSEEVRETPLAVLVGDVKDKPQDQWALINLLNAFRASGHTTVTVGDAAIRSLWGKSCTKSCTKLTEPRQPLCKTLQRLTPRSLNLSAIGCWCGRGDSNPYDVATASPSSWCVCQFRHFRVRQLVPVLHRTPHGD